MLTKSLFMRKPLPGLLGKLLHKKKFFFKAQRPPSSAFGDFSGMRSLKRYCLQLLGLEPLPPLIRRSGCCGYAVTQGRKCGPASALLSIRPKAIPSTAHKHIPSLCKHWQTWMQRSFCCQAMSPSFLPSHISYSLKTFYKNSAVFLCPYLVSSGETGQGEQRALECYLCHSFPRPLYMWEQNLRKVTWPKTWQDGVKNSVPRSLSFPLLNVASPEALAYFIFYRDWNSFLVNTCEPQYIRFLWLL